MSKSNNASFVQRAGAKYNFFRYNQLKKRGRGASAFVSLVRAARNGHSEAAYLVGLSYANGMNCAQSGSEAIYWYEVAAEAGHSGAQLELGNLLLNDHDIYWCAGSSAAWANDGASRESHLLKAVIGKGIVSSRDEKKAFAMLHEAAVAGLAAAQANLGWLLLKGIGCEVNIEMAKRWFEAAAEDGVNQAALGLAEIFGNNEGVFFDENKKQQWLRIAADGGNASAAYQVGLSYKLSSPQADVLDARLYFEKSVKLGHREAAYELAAMLLSARESEKDIADALEHLRNCAKKGHISSAAWLGDLYSRGDMIKPDLREAAKWYRQAADAGHIYSQFQVACFFARGDGVPKDLNNAARYFELSAEGGHLIGALNVSVFYERGNGVLKDPQRAIHWLRIAADGGLAQAQVRLAHLLESGVDGPSDAFAITKLYEAAAAQDDAEAKYQLAKNLLKSSRVDDVHRARQLLMESINKGHMSALELMLAHANQIGCERKQIAELFEVLHKAADRGDLRAIILLARELQTGNFISKDLFRAESLLRKAADLEFPPALFELGVLFCKRNESADDLSNGLTYYVRAAEKGHPTGQFNAGLMLLRGVGGQQDLPLATQFLREAAAQGIPMALEVLSEAGITVT